MSQYLSKEEIRQWRSSLEKITLEEFAARLGKVINEEKETRDIVDIVLENDPLLVHENYRVKTEKINMIAKKALVKEREITTVKNSVAKSTLEAPSIPEVKSAVKTAKTASEKTEKASKAKPIELKVENDDSSSGIKVSFKKPLTEREQLVFEHFLANKNSIVYAKDLAKLLSLPRDYVYKYIKNLRNKIAEDALENASNGGYVLRA